jgi:homoserine O-acetyltransferase
MEERVYVVPDFVTESGVVLPEAKLVYGTAGTINDAGTNAVLVPSHYMADLHDSEWMVGDGLAIDPADYFIVATELFGNGRSSSPSTTPAPFDGPRFPAVTIRDNVEIVHSLLTRELGVRHLSAVVGFSMGAMQAFQWAVSHPRFVDRVVADCGTAKSYPHGNVRLEAQIAAIKTDPAFAAGDYSDQPAAGIEAFGMAWAPWLYTQRWWRDSLWLELDPDTTYENVVEGFRTEFLPGADANDIILQCRTWQQHDVGSSPGFSGDTDAALRSITADVLYLPSETDLYFPLYDAVRESDEIAKVTLRPIPSLWGHPAGSGPNAVDADFVNRAVSSFLRDGTVPSAAVDAESEGTVATDEPADEEPVDDDLAGDYLATLAILFSGVASTSVGVLSDRRRSEIDALFESALAAIAVHSIPGLHRYGWDIVFAVVDASPNRVLVDAARGGLMSAIRRFSRTSIAQVADWDLLTERYSELRLAIRTGDVARTVDAIQVLYQLPSNAAV